jgi:hypothetical protein
MIILLSPEKKRIKSQDLCLNLEKMYQNVKNGNTYCQTLCPRDRPIKACVAVDAFLHKEALKVMKEANTELRKHKGRTQPSISPEQLRKLAE